MLCSAAYVANTPDVKELSEDPDGIVGDLNVFGEVCLAVSPVV